MKYNREHKSSEEVVDDGLPKTDLVQNDSKSEGRRLFDNIFKVYFNVIVKRVMQENGFWSQTCELVGGVALFHGITSKCI